MKKVIGSLFSLLFVIIIGTVLLITYRDLKPKQQTVNAPQVNSLEATTKDINFINLETKLLNEDGTYYLWFCDEEDNNCAYVENEFITPMLNKLNITEFKNMHRVNFTNCRFSKRKLLDKYNVDSTLAFVKVEVEDDNIEYSDGITWKNDENFTFDDLQKWLYDHNIWQETYEARSSNK